MKKRMEFDFGGTSFNRLARLRKKIGAKKDVDVIKNALQIYEWMVGRHQRGLRFYSGIAHPIGTGDGVHGFYIGTLKEQDIFAGADETPNGNPIVLSALDFQCITASLAVALAEIEDSADCLPAGVVEDLRERLGSIVEVLKERGGEDLR